MWIDELDREELPLPFIGTKSADWTIAVTGGRGYIGSLVCERLAAAGGTVLPLDLPEYDLLKPRAAAWADLPLAELDAIIHLAAHKEAIMGEELPGDVADLNVRGTQFITDLGVPVVLASTCKAVDPCTAYGASKLIAERIVLNAGGCVVRLVNVLGSSRSVVPIWDAVPKDEPLPVTRCERMWITPDEAVGLMIAGLAHCKQGRRIIPDVPPPEPVAKLALRLHPERSQLFVPLRRGDRPIEKLVGENEAAMPAVVGTRVVVDAWQLEKMRGDDYYDDPPLAAHMDDAPLEKTPGHAPTLAEPSPVSPIRGKFEGEPTGEWPDEDDAPIQGDQTEEIERGVSERDRRDIAAMDGDDLGGDAA